MRIRTISVAAFLATTVLGGTIGAAHAAPPKSPAQISCEARGFVWDANRGGCNDLWCLDGLFGYGDPGEVVIFHNKAYYCNGWTGDWTEEIAAATQTGAITTGTVSVSSTTPVRLGVPDLGGVATTSAPAAPAN